MSGYPLQVGDLPPGIVAIRVIRESFQANLPNQTVLLRVGTSDRVLSATTNAEGRVQFDGLQIGESVRVRATVEAEVLESQRFELPAQAGVRMVLVAGVGAGLAVAPEPWPPAVAAPTSVPILPPPLPMAAAAAAGSTAPQMTTAPVPVREKTAVTSMGLVVAFTAVAVVAGGVLFGRRRPGTTPGTRQRDANRPAPEAPASTAVVASTSSRTKREAVFEELLGLERSASAANTDGEAYSTRREALMNELVRLDAPPDDLPNA